MSDSERRRNSGGGIVLLLGILLVIGLILWWWFYRPFELPIPGFGGSGGGGGDAPADSLPNAPSNITGESAPIFDIFVQWADNSDNEVGFRVYRQRIDQEEPLTFAGATSANHPAFSDLDTWCGATYQYTISSFNEVGESPATECWQITLPVCPQSNTAALSTGLEGGLNFITNAKGADSDLYWALTTDNQPIFMGDQEGQQGLLDLGEVGDTPLYRVTLPGGVTYKRDGVTVVQGHTYAARARDGQNVIIFTVKAMGDPLSVEYIIYTPEEAITGSCDQIPLTIPPGLAYSSEDSAGSDTGGSGTGGDTAGSTTGGDTVGLDDGGTTGQTSSTGTTTGTATDGGDTGGPCVLDLGDGICCTLANEDPTNEPACRPPGDGQGGCNDPCQSAAQCAGVNPVCIGGACYDAALCDPGSTGGSTGGNNDGGNNNGGNNDGGNNRGGDNGNTCPCKCSGTGAAPVCYDCQGNVCTP